MSLLSWPLYLSCIGSARFSFRLSARLKCFLNLSKWKFNPPTHFYKFHHPHCILFQNRLLLKILSGLVLSCFGDSFFPGPSQSHLIWYLQLIILKLHVSLYKLILHLTVNPGDKAHSSLAKLKLLTCFKQFLIGSLYHSVHHIVWEKKCFFLAVIYKCLWMP